MGCRTHAQGRCTLTKNPTQEKWRETVRDERVTHKHFHSLLQCAWYRREESEEEGKNGRAQWRPRGNRRLLSFFCRHPVLGGMLEAKLVQLFLLLSEARTGQNGLQLLNTVEGVLLQLRSEGSDRLDR